MSSKVKKEHKLVNAYEKKITFLIIVKVTVKY